MASSCGIKFNGHTALASPVPGTVGYTPTGTYPARNGLPCRLRTSLRIAQRPGTQTDWNMERDDESYTQAFAVTTCCTGLHRKLTSQAFKLLIDTISRHQ